MPLQRKTLALGAAEVKFDKGKGRFVGYGAFFNNVDSDRDIIKSGAFSDTLRDRPNVKMFFNHKYWDIPIGSYPVMKEDDKGLLVEGQLTEGMSVADDVFAAMKAGTVDGLSIGYSLDPDGWEYDADKTVRILKKINLVEISVVTFPANESARIDLNSVKSEIEALQTIADYERFLRDAGGMSKQLAKTLVSRARDIFRRDAGEDPEQKGLDEVVSLIRARQTILP